MPVLVFATSRVSPRKPRVPTAYEPVAGVQRRVFGVPQSNIPHPDPKEIFLARYYAHLFARTPMPHARVNNAFGTQAHTSRPMMRKDAPPPIRLTTEQKRQDFLERHRRLQDERRETQMRKERESAAKAQVFLERWQKFTGRATKPVSAADAQVKLNESRDGTSTFSRSASSSTSKSTKSSSSNQPNSLSSSPSISPPTSTSTPITPSPRPSRYSNLTPIYSQQPHMTPFEWKEYGARVKGYVLFAKQFTPDLIEDGFDRAERMGVHYTEPAIRGRRRRPSF